jgi:V8-like Glu-specific endopeptidase
MSTRAHILGLTALACLVANVASAQVERQGALTVFKIPDSAAQASAVDIANARPMPLPLTSATPKSLLDALREYTPSTLAPAMSAGQAGTLRSKRERIGLAQADEDEDEDEGVTPQEFGTSNHPFSTARLDGTLRVSNSSGYRRSGKLYFKIGGSTSWCSASLIKRGVIVTAAHCVANFGKKQFYTNWVFHPATNEALVPVDPYGSWTGAQVWIKSSYYDGTEVCYQAGVICPNDVAVIVLNQGRSYPGNTLGWNGYGYNGWGFNPSGQTLITQLGYPGGLDSGKQMQRNDSQGFKNTTFSSNTIIGSLMDGGSSGGPWINNFGVAPVLSGGLAHGSYATPNIIVGVTSWGYINQAVKQQGASPFTSNNIVSLVNSACTAVPAAC